MDKPQYLGSKIRWDYVKAAIPDHKDFAVHGIALDIGAEGGLYRDLIKSKGYDYRGCDIDPKGIAIEKCDAYDLETLELYDKCDLIIFVDVLEHLDDPEKAIKEMKHCLKPGGTLIFHTPNINQSNILFKHSQHPDHKVEGFKREQLLDLFKDFDLTLTKTFNFLECVAWEINYLLMLVPHPELPRPMKLYPQNIIDFDQKNYVPLGWLGVCRLK